MNHLDKVKATDKAFYHVGEECKGCQHFRLLSLFNVYGCDIVESCFPPHDNKEDCEHYEAKQ